MERKSFHNGMTVAELKKRIADWPETDQYGEPTEVWIETGDGESNQVKSIWPLNNGDILLSDE